MNEHHTSGPDAATGPELATDEVVRVVRRRLGA